MSDRITRLRAARLYLVCDVQSDRFLTAALRGGVDIVQLRAKRAGEASRSQPTGASGTASAS